MGFNEAKCVDLPGHSLALGHPDAWLGR